MKPAKIKILVVDDHYVVRMGLCGSINMEADMTVVGEATNAQQAMDLFRTLRPNVALMDLRLPGINGVEATRKICAEFPDAQIIVISTFDGDEDIYRAFQAGARAYLLKSVQREELLQAIRTVNRGEQYVPTHIAARLSERLRRGDLSARESEVLELLVKGLANKEIAAFLNISEVTVKLHVSNLLVKLNVADRTQAVTAALQRGIVHLQ